MKINSSPVSKWTSALFSITVFLVPIFFPKVKSSLFNEYFKPFVLIFVAFGKGIREIIFSLQFTIVFFFFAKK